MRKNQLKLVEKAKPFSEGLKFQSIYIINSGKNYNGFWGSNGYRKLILIGETWNGELYRIDQCEADLIDIINKQQSNIYFDINSVNDCVRLSVGYSNYIIIENNKISSQILQITGEIE